MQVSVYAVGKKMPAWVSAASSEYARRLPKRWRYSVREFAQIKTGNAELSREREASVLCSAIPEKSHVVALDNLGQNWSTSQLSDQLKTWQSIGKDIIFLIGGPDGLHVSCRDRADQTWSLSALTFPHPMVRVVLVEQLYRAQSLLDNHPYHRS